MIKFGVFSDVHYAKNKTYGNRYCDLSIKKLEKCIETFNSRCLDFIINLGDIIDKAENNSDDTENLKRVYKVASRFKGCIHNVLGNHDLESMNKHQFMEIIGQNKPSTYYSFDVKEHHFIVLDANYKEDGKAYQSGNYDWKDTYLHDDQKNWLLADLEKCKSSSVIIFTHQNLDHRFFEGNIDPHIIKNALEIRKIFENSKKKITVIQGHYHHGYSQTINGIDYITLKAMCEGNEMKNNSYMIISINNDDTISIENF